MSFLTTGEAARMCGVQLNTIKNWIRSGEIPAIRTPGGHWRIPRSAFLSFMSRMGISLSMTSDRNKPGQKPCILIIDDDPVAHDLMSDILALEFPWFEIRSVRDGYTGLIEIGLYQPELILLDIMMPGINGLEIIQRLKQANSPMPHARVIAVTAASDRRLVVNRIRAAGPEALLFKPLEPTKLIEAVREVLEDTSTMSAFCDSGAGI